MNTKSPQELLALRSTLRQSHRIVVKIGTNTLSLKADEKSKIGPAPAKTSGLDTEYLHRVAIQIAKLLREGREIILVSSGAIGMGAHELGLKKKVKEIPLRQACASIGQPLLMNEYRNAFGIYGMTVAQVLVTRSTWDNRGSYLNLKNAVDQLLELQVVPIFNENDTISTAEIGDAFGDNDQLSAYVASKVDADLLILLTDIDSLYDDNPKSNPEAKPIPYVEYISPELRAAAKDRGSEFSTGGMKTKIRAVEIARDGGCRVVIAHGRHPDILDRICSGELEGTLFEASPDHVLKNRSRWLKNARAQGKIYIDKGAFEALTKKKSLLPKGITRIEGSFPQEAVVLVNDAIKLISAFSSSELESIKGKHSEAIEQILGKGRGHVIARPEDMVFLDLD